MTAPTRIPKQIKDDQREAADVDCSPSLPAQGAYESQCSDECRTTTLPEDVSHVSGSATGKRDGEKLPLDPDEFDTLREMIHEYKAHRVDFSCLPKRPKFRGPRVNSGFTCNDEIRGRASTKARTDPHGTGGSLSSLIELLLWKYLGCPSDVIERASGQGNDP